MNKLGESRGNRGKGRKKGSQNKNTQEIKSMIMAALNEAGGQDYFVTQALENPVAFLGLIGKILPKHVDATIEGELAITEIRRIIIDSNFSGGFSEL